ncbi:MAG TPA: YetF domain-containing protein [Lacipirellulaceae bacterium]|nr:YetF domain-containing protein [Lacipirellulaceae bacterium]
MIDWHSFFVPTVSLLELVVRGSIIYLFLFVLLRVLIRRHIGALNLPDMLLLVLIADAAQNAMSSEYHSVPEGLVLCTTLICWNYLLDWLAYRYEWLRPWLEPPPLSVISNGRINRRNLRLELITVDELMNQLRERGIEDVGLVKKAFLEPDGQLGIITKDRKNKSKVQEPKSRRAGAP